MYLNRRPAVALRAMARQAEVRGQRTEAERPEGWEAGSDKATALGARKNELVIKRLKVKFFQVLVKNFLAKPPGFAKATTRQAKLAKVIC
jgi:hypothetical protein